MAKAKHGLPADDPDAIAAWGKYAWGELQEAETKLPREYDAFGRDAHKIVVRSLKIPSELSKSMYEPPVSGPLTPDQARQNVKVLMEWAARQNRLRTQDHLGPKKPAPMDVLANLVHDSAALPTAEQIQEIHKLVSEAVFHAGLLLGYAKNEAPPGLEGLFIAGDDAEGDAAWSAFRGLDGSFGVVRVVQRAERHFPGSGNARLCGVVKVNMHEAAAFATYIVYDLAARFWLMRRKTMPKETSDHECWRAAWPEVRDKLRSLPLIDVSDVRVTLRREFLDATTAAPQTAIPVGEYVAPTNDPAAAPVDLRDYALATVIRTKHTPLGVVLDQRKLIQFLAIHTDIRTARPLGKDGKPRPNRLMVHLADWAKHQDALREWHSAETADPINQVSESEVAERKEAIGKKRRK